MKVLHFKTNYLNLSETFINRFVRNQKRYEPVVATCYPRSYTGDINLYAMPDSGLKGSWNTLQLKLNKTPSFLYDVVEKEKPDVIHGHFGLDTYRLLGLQRASNLPLIVNFYGYDVLRLPKEFGWKRRYKKMARRADMVFVGSEDMKGNVIDLGFDEEKIRVLKLGMNLEEIRYKHHTSAGPKLMMVGRMVEKKGFEYAVQAIDLLRNDGVNVQLDLYGDGQLQEEIGNLVKSLGLKDRILLHGQTENEKIFEELYKHDMLLVPSVQAKDGDREGIPQTTVEGMATGIPVIASDHAGLPELVIDRETGLQIPERDAAALSNAIKTYLENDDLAAKVSANGRKRVEQEHSISTQVNKMESWYDELV
jgi:glycosyltransferase involved in cell wall biosynthesis